MERLFIDKNKKGLAFDISKMTASDVKKIACTSSSIFCLKNDGTVEYLGKDEDAPQKLAEKINVAYVSAPVLAADGEWAYAVAIMEDGTADSTGFGVYYTYEKRKSGFTGYTDYYEAHPDGRYCNVSDWKLW